MSTPDTPPQAPAGRDAERVLAELVRETLDEKRRARRWNIAFRAVWVVLALVGLALLAGEGSRGDAAGPHTALVRIEGVIEDGGETSAYNVVKSLRDAYANPAVKGLVLQINSPGGSPVQSDLIYREIRRLRAQRQDVAVHAVVMDLCASGGYYIAAAADRIYVNPSSIVGSIGVIMNGFGFTGGMERLGIERRLLTAGDNKAFLDPFSPVKPAETEHAQRLLDGIHAEFIAAVRQGRGDRLKDNGQLFGGLMWTGKQAITLGLADAVGSTGSVAREVIKAANVVDYTSEPDLAERVAKRFGAAAGTAMANAVGGFGIR